MIVTFGILLIIMFMKKLKVYFITLNIIMILLANFSFALTAQDLVTPTHNELNTSQDHSAHSTMQTPSMDCNVVCSTMVNCTSCMAFTPVHIIDNPVQNTLIFALSTDPSLYSVDLLVEHKPPISVE